jgi:hypothetical protein
MAFLWIWERGYLLLSSPSPSLFMREKMHNKKEWDAKNFNVDYYEKSVNTPYGGFIKEYTWENFSDHAFMKMDFIKRVFGPFYVKSILFGGCAKGFEIRAAKERGYDAYGIDISEYAITHAEPSIKSRCELGTMVDLSRFKDNEFDLFASFDAWHTIHPEDRVQTAKEVSRVAKKGVLIRTGFSYGGESQFRFAPRTLGDSSGYYPTVTPVAQPDPVFNGTYDGNPSYQDSFWLFSNRFDSIGKFFLFFSPVVWDRDYFIWYSLCRRQGNESLIRTYGANGGAFHYD